MLLVELVVSNLEGLRPIETAFEGIELQRHVLEGKFPSVDSCRLPKISGSIMFRPG